MPRRTSGGPKAPVRALTSLLRELDPTTKNTLNSAFADAETLIDFHSRSVPERQRRRRISGLVSTIVLTGKSNLLGGFLEWRRLDDPRISMYEAQVSDDDIFSNPETLTVLETFLALENLRTIKFARVRGVQANGNCGLWSNTVRISPRTSAPAVYSLDFYQRYFGSEPKLGRFLRYSGGLSHLDWEHPQFYQVFQGDFYVDRLVGALTAYGYICSRLKKYADGGITPWDRVRFKVDGITRMDGYFPHWTSVPHERNFNKNDFHATSGAKMTFYMQGGYTASFGPYAVTIPNTLNGLGPNDPRSVAQQDTTDGAFYWYDTFNASRASRYDEAQLFAFNDTRPAHEAHSDQIIEGGLTDWILFRDFRMEVPSDATIFGIEAKVKRRQPNILNDAIGVNFGNKRPDIGLGHDLVQEHNIGGAGVPRLQFAHIFEDVDFGRAIDLTCNTVGTGAFAAGRLQHDISGIPTDGLITVADADETRLWTGNKVTFSAWFRLPTPLSAYGAGTRDSYVFAPESTSSSPLRGARMFVTHNATTNAITSYTFRWEHGSFLNFNITASGTISQVNRWHLFTVTYDQTLGTNGDLNIYIDGVERGGTLTSSSFNKNLFTGSARWLLAIGGFSTIAKISIMSMAHFAIWDRVLTAEEIRELYEAKGRVDYRKNFGDYASASELNHYFLVFPERTDIRDHQVCLVDNNGTIRTDLDNKAVDESWPQLAQFFYTDLRQHGFLPLAVSDGPTHDNHTAIGYQTYGGELDQWGTTWTPQQVNSFYFGVAVRATNRISLGYRGDAFIDHAKLTVYTRPRFDRTVNVRAEVAVSNQFYLEREIFGGIMNLIELGEKLEADD